jgi:hypothetical protein
MSQPAATAITGGELRAGAEHLVQPELAQQQPEHRGADAAGQAGPGASAQTAHLAGQVPVCRHTSLRSSVDRLFASRSYPASFLSKLAAAVATIITRRR